MDDAEPRAVNAQTSIDPLGGGQAGGSDAALSARAPTGAQMRAFNRFASLAALVFDASCAAVVLTQGRLQVIGSAGQDPDQWIAHPGLIEASQAHDGPIYSVDPRQEPSFAGKPVGGALRFWAATPLVTTDGETIGVLTVADSQPHTPPTAAQRAGLSDLAALAADQAARLSQADTKAAPIDLGPLAKALDAAQIGAFIWNISAGAITLNEQLRQMVGGPSECSANSWEEIFDGLVHVDDRERTLDAVRHGLEAEGRYQVEHRLVGEGGEPVYWVSSIGVLVKTGLDDPGRVVGVVQDATQRKLAEDQRETVVAELDHRVKNVLSAVQSMAAQSARKAISLEAFLKTFTGRLKSMASAHQLLTTTRWRGASMGSVAAAELGGIAPGQTRWEGPDLLLYPRAANAMSLALHELAINAVKFGALSIETGRVDVRWLTLANGGLELQWTESLGPRVSPPARRGFGATLLEDVTGRELGGSVTVEYRREGVTAVIRTAASVIAPPLAPEVVPQSEPDAAPRSHDHVSQPHSLGPARIDGLRLLIVEDALLLALELEAGLEEAGAIIVGSAADVDEAMRLIDQPLDAAVLDANLNGASVMPVAEALAARGVPFVFATGYGESRFNFAGFDAPVIRKPYDVTQVAAALAEVTGAT